MTGKPRPDFAGAWHHVMNRGGRHAPIFEDDDCSDGVEDFMRNIHCVRHGPMVGSARHRDRVARRGHSDSQSFRVRALAADSRSARRYRARRLRDHWSELERPARACPRTRGESSQALRRLGAAALHISDVLRSRSASGPVAEPGGQGARPPSGELLASDRGVIGTPGGLARLGDDECQVVSPDTDPRHTPFSCRRVVVRGLVRCPRISDPRSHKKDGVLPARLGRCPVTRTSPKC